jgi:hypothetical protein
VKETKIREEVLIPVNLLHTMRKLLTARLDGSTDVGAEIEKEKVWGGRIKALSLIFLRGEACRSRPVDQESSKLCSTNHEDRKTPRKIILLCLRLFVV